MNQFDFLCLRWTKLGNLTDDISIKVQHDVVHHNGSVLVNKVHTVCGDSSWQDIFTDRL